MVLTRVGSAPAGGIISGASFAPTGQACAVNLKTHAAKKLTVKGQYIVSGFGMSRNEKQVLVGYGSFLGRPLAPGRIASIPFGGGNPTVLVRGAVGPSWNR